jgi:hypothetical protein
VRQPRTVCSVGGKGSAQVLKSPHNVEHGAAFVNKESVF